MLCYVGNVLYEERTESGNSTNLPLRSDLDLLASTHKLQYSVLGRRHFILIGLQRGGTSNGQMLPVCWWDAWLVKAGKRGDDA
jgi:hypothetical protein